MEVILAVIVGGNYEKDMTMKIATYLRDYLNEYSNVNVILTHSGSTMSIEDRADFARNNKADLLLSIHINNSTSSSIQGAEAYVTYRTDLPKYNQEMSTLGNLILRNIGRYGINGKGSVTTRKVVNIENEDEYKYYDGQGGDYYGIIRRAMKGGHVKSLGPDFRDGSGVPTVLVEHGYLSNSHDRSLMDSDSDLKALAKADLDAIVEFYSLKKKNDNSNNVVNVSNVDIRQYLFNSTYYADKNPDVKNALGYNENALRNHYYSNGIKEGRSASPIFDPHYYLNKYPDLKNAFGKNCELAYNHFVTCGINEGRSASKYFDSKYYLDINPDLKNAFDNNSTRAVEHFAIFGINEGRIASGEFNIKEYYSNSSGYIKNVLGRNYIKYYAKDGGANVVTQDSPIDIRNYLFDANVYYNLYPDLQIALGNNSQNLRNHYYACGIKEGRSASLVFDPHYYLNKYPDLRNAFGNNCQLAYNHFVTCGINEGRSASQYFDPVYYLNSYKDLQDAFGKNYSKALEHFVVCGIKEGRKGNQ